MSSADNDRILFAEFELDRAHRKLLRDGEPVALYAKAFDLLEFLIEHNGKVVSKRELLDEVWPDQFVEEANLSVQVSALRKALGETTDAPRFLVTVPGVGYKFVAEIRSTADDEIVIEKHRIERFVISDESDLSKEQAAAQLPAAPLGHRALIFGAAALALVLLAAGIGGYFLVKTERRSEIRSVAVLPFTSQDQTVESEYIGEGLADSVIHALSGVEGLRVMSRNSAFRYRGTEPDAGTIGRELDVDAILTGRIVTVGDNLSVRAELIATDDNSVIWGEQLTRKLSDLERLQTDIARSISDKLRLKLSTAGEDRLKRNETTDPEAYQLYLHGRFHLNRFTDDGFLKARDYFQQAIDKDRNYAMAYVGLAEAYNRLCGYNAMPSSECFPKSRAAAETAIGLDATLADAYAMVGSVNHFYDWDWTGAERNFRRALEIDPENAQAHQLFSYHLTGMGRFDDSRAEMHFARELDPLSIEKSVGIAEILFFQKRFDEALANANKSLELDPNAGFVHWVIGNIYREKGMYDEAIKQYERSIPLSGDSPDEPASLAYTYALAGRKDEARRILSELKQRSKTQYISPCILAVIHAGLGENDEAFELLDRAYEQRDFMLTLLKIEPSYDRLRGDPRYAALMRRVGFTE